MLLYDLRSSQPLLVKDHFYNLPIKCLDFHNQLDLVVSADSKIIKIWNRDTVRRPVKRLNDPLTLMRNFFFKPRYLLLQNIFLCHESRDTDGWTAPIGLPILITFLLDLFSLCAPQGKVFSSIQPQTNINDVCIYPDSGERSVSNSITSSVLFSQT